MSKTLVTTFVIALGLFSQLGTTTAQEKTAKQVKYEEDLELLRKRINSDSTAKLRQLGDTRILDFIAIAEQAESRIFTPEDSELRRMARDLDSKLNSLQESDLGRWVATRPKAVATFIKLDTEYSQLSDDALNLRKERLAVSITALKNYKPKTQGEFDPSTNEAVLAILEDANWVEEHYSSLRNCLAAIADYSASFPSDQDWSTFPTLREAKDARIARMFEEIHSSELDALEEANKINSKKIAESVFEREIQKTNTQLFGDETLADLERKLMEAEFGRRETEIDRRIMATILEKQRIKDDIVQMKEVNQADRLEEYLTSERVKSLLSPFCEKGFCEAMAGVGFRRNDSLTKVPMSLSKIAVQNALGANQNSMKQLIRIATNSGNDRPGWPINDQNYADDGNEITNMDGEKVNRYIEAQRILREHGPKLIELGLLRN